MSERLPWFMRLTLVNDKTDQKAPIIYPSETPELLDSLDSCQIPYGSGAYSHLAVSYNRVKPDSLQMELARMIENISRPPSIQELNHLGFLIQKMSWEGRRAYEQELQRYPGLDIQTTINAAHSILYDSVVYDGVSMADRALPVRQHDPLVRVQLVPADMAGTMDPNAGVWINCPAKEQTLESARRAMGVDSLDELTVNTIGGMLYLGCTPLMEAHESFVRFSDINRMAAALNAQGGITQAGKFKALLMSDGSADFGQAADLAERLGTYEYISTVELRQQFQKVIPENELDRWIEDQGFDETDYGCIRAARGQTLDQLLEILSQCDGFEEPSGPGGSDGGMTLSSL